MAHSATVRKESPKPVNKVVVIGGDNYRIGLRWRFYHPLMPQAVIVAVLMNAVQRANAEM